MRGIRCRWWGISTVGHLPAQGILFIAALLGNVNDAQVCVDFVFEPTVTTSNNNKDDKSKSRDVPDEESGEFVYWDTNEAAPRGIFEHYLIM